MVLNYDTLQYKVLLDMNTTTLLPPTKGMGLRLLTLLSTVSILMLSARSDSWLLGMLAWNLFLAWIPLLAVMGLRVLLRHRLFSGWVLWPGLTIWLLFLPNSPYIITDLFHVRDVSEYTLWFDTMLLFMFALTGLLTGLYSLLLVHRLLNERIGRGWSWLAMLACLTLTSFGIYLGRYIRLNSWHIVTHPVWLARSVHESLINPFALKLTLSYTFALVALYMGFVEYVQRRTHESMD